MSRSGYIDDFDQWSHIRYRGQVTSAIRGKRGQAFLIELVQALDALPDKKLIARELQEGSNVCAIGSVGVMRGVDMSKLDPEDPYSIADTFGIAHQLVREIEYENDEGYWGDTDAQRWSRMRAWAFSHLTAESRAAITLATTPTREGEDG